MKAELEFYIHTEESATEWSVLAYYITAPENEFKIATINLDGSVTWVKEYESLKDEIGLKNELKNFFDFHFFTPEDTINEIVKYLAKQDELFFTIYYKDGECDYGIECINAVQTYFWAYGLVESESIGFVPYKPKETAYRNLATDVVNDIIDIVGNEEFCIYID